MGEHTEILTDIALQKGRQLPLLSLSLSALSLRECTLVKATTHRFLFYALKKTSSV